jgi:outer membrane protein assembly factor BamB
MLSFCLTACHWDMDDYVPLPRYAKGDLWVSNFRDWRFPATTLINDKLYCSTLELQDPSTNLFYCLDLKTGKVDWAVPIVDWASSPPIVGDSFIYFTTFTGKRIYKFDKEGNILWEKKGESVFNGYTLNPLNNNLIYHSLTDGSYELAFKDGALVNHFAKTSMASSAPVFYGQYMVQAGVKEDTTITRHGTLMRCIDYTSKKKVWEYEAGDGIKSLSVNNGILYFVAPYHIMHAVDIKTGTRLWQSDTLRRNTPHPMDPKLIIEKGQIVYYEYLDNMIVLDQATGKVFAKVGYQDVLKRGLLLPVNSRFRIPADDKSYYSVLVTDSLIAPSKDYNIYVRKVAR